MKNLVAITLTTLCLLFNAKAQYPTTSTSGVGLSKLIGGPFQIFTVMVDGSGFAHSMWTNMVDHPHFYDGVSNIVQQAALNEWLAASNTARALVIAATPTAPSVSSTSFVSGQRYTNTSGVLIEASTRVSTTTALIAGGASIEMRVYDGSGSLVITPDWHGVGTALLTLSPTTSASIRGKVPAGYSWAYTNTSTGAGNSATTIASSGQITFLP